MASSFAIQNLFLLAIGSLVNYLVRPLLHRELGGEVEVFVLGAIVSIVSIGVLWFFWGRRTWGPLVRGKISPSQLQEEARYQLLFAAIVSASTIAMTAYPMTSAIGVEILVSVVLLAAYFSNRYWILWVSLAADLVYLTILNVFARDSLTVIPHLLCLGFQFFFLGGMAKTGLVILERKR